MTGPRPNSSKPVTGLHETLITSALEEQLKELIAAGTVVIAGPVSDESSQHVLTRHVAHAVGQVLRKLPLATRCMPRMKSCIP